MPPCKTPTEVGVFHFMPTKMGVFYLGWLMGLEPTTTGITILDSTN